MAKDADAATQPHHGHDRRWAPLVWLVWIQRWLRTCGRQRLCGRFCQHVCGDMCGSNRLASRREVARRTHDYIGSGLRHCGRLGSDHSSLFCGQSGWCTDCWRARRRDLRTCGQSEVPFRIRRFTRCCWGAPRRWTGGHAADRCASYRLGARRCQRTAVRWRRRATRQASYRRV